MSDKEHSGAPAETQQSGFGGERRGSAAPGLPPRAPAGGRTPPRGASRPPPPEGQPNAPTVSRETPDGPGEALGKNKRSSFYVYLVVLFGAAFLMLLLAYFVQRRNNETAISELRSTMDLSREELMEEIKGLEKEREELNAALQAAADAQIKVEEERDTAIADYEHLKDGYNKYVGYASILEGLYAAEVKLSDKDYDGAAAELTDIEYQYFVDTIGDYDAEMGYYNPEGLFLRPRFDALVEELIRRGALDEDWAG